jgi:hypothetical protein
MFKKWVGKVVVAKAASKDVNISEDDVPVEASIYYVGHLLSVGKTFIMLDTTGEGTANVALNISSIEMLTLDTSILEKELTDKLSSSPAVSDDIN